MEQLELPLKFGFQVGDRVKVVGKSIGDHLRHYNHTRFEATLVINRVSIYPADWNYSACNPPKQGETYYLIDGNYFLAKDLKEVKDDGTITATF